MGTVGKTKRPPACRRKTLAPRPAAADIVMLQVMHTPVADLIRFGKAFFLKTGGKTVRHHDLAHQSPFSCHRVAHAASAGEAVIAPLPVGRCRSFDRRLQGQQFVGPQPGVVSNPGGQAVPLGLRGGNSFDLLRGITPGGKTGFNLVFHHVKLNTQVHLDCLAIEIQRLLGHLFRQLFEVLQSLFRCYTGQVPQVIGLEILGKPLERLFIVSCSPHAMDAPVILVVMTALAKGQLAGNCMLGLSPGGSKTWHMIFLNRQSRKKRIDHFY
jgi:hypothetical protein